jgi:hypothetical protein
MCELNAGDRYSHMREVGVIKLALDLTEPHSYC